MKTKKYIPRLLYLTNSQHGYIERLAKKYDTTFVEALRRILDLTMANKGEESS